jgi:NADH-quinone oxidoreductase subunit J
LLAAALVGELVWALTRSSESGAFPAGATDSVAAIGRSLFTDYSFAFEVTSVLILVAMLGAVVLAHRDRRSGADRAPVAPVGPVVPVIHVRAEKP